ncbi:MAG TPA: sulfurtransferase TusA family protein [Gammaproteobacteria bacterium]|nr:sulfurtransferase TusA family protein [Gammaproteobacteria bacterium]
MWPFRKKEPYKTIGAVITTGPDGRVSVDVRGQTCPGYLLSINKAIDSLEQGTSALLLMTYAPCGDDVHAWCKEKGYTFDGLFHEDGIWKIAVTK